MKRNFIDFIKPGPAFFAGSVLLGLGFGSLSLHAENISIAHSGLVRLGNYQATPFVSGDKLQKATKYFCRW